MQRTAFYLHRQQWIPPKANSSSAVSTTLVNMEHGTSGQRYTQIYYIIGDDEPTRWLLPIHKNVLIGQGKYIMKVRDYVSPVPMYLHLLEWRKCVAPCRIESASCIACNRNPHRTHNVHQTHTIFVQKHTADDIFRVSFKRVGKLDGRGHIRCPRTSLKLVLDQ